MATILNPYLSFAGNAREAMEFYRDTFGGALTVSTYGEFGTPDESYTNKVMHSRLQTDEGLTLMGSDVPPGMEHQPGNTMSVSLSGDDAESLRGYWAKLSDGGTVNVALEKQMWGDEFGLCIDRFGVTWMVDIAVPESTAVPES